MTTTLRLTALLLRTYVRDRSAVFFGFLLPFLFMVIFGSLNFGTAARPQVGVVDLARNSDSATFLKWLPGNADLRVVVVEREAGRERLRRSELDVLVVLPADFRTASARPPIVEVLENGAAPQNVAVVRAALDAVVASMSFRATGTGPVIQLARQEVAGARLRYVDFLLPGILGMNVMQLSVLGIAFTLVALKQTGALRRIMATPLDMRSFIAAHGLMRLILSTIQVAILIAAAGMMFGVRTAGGIPDLLLLSMVGSLPFLMIGFALAGWGRSVDQVAPIAQLITLPQLFVSGVFFSKDAAPAMVKPFTDLLPLTFLIDGLREIAVQGATLWDVRMQVVGLLAWTVAGFALALAVLRTRRASEAT